MIASPDRFGPWADGLDHAERVARCRCLRAIVHLSLGLRGQGLADELDRAERNDQALQYALFGLNALAPVDRRHVLASCAALHRPNPHTYARERREG